MALVVRVGRSMLILWTCSSVRAIAARMRVQLEFLLRQALKKLNAQAVIAENRGVSVEVRRCSSDRSDYSTNLALQLSGRESMRPAELAQIIVSAMPDCAALQRVEIAENGFINFFQSRRALHAIIAQVLEQGSEFGCTLKQSNSHWQIRCVLAIGSAPLTVNQGRVLTLAGCIARLLANSGGRVQKHICDVKNETTVEQQNLAIEMGFDADAWIEYEQHKQLPGGAADGTKILLVANPEAYAQMQGTIAIKADVRHSSAFDRLLVCQSVKPRRALTNSIDDEPSASLVVLLDSLGGDSLRFGLTMRSSQRPLLLEAESLRSRLDERPGYCVQYAYARICSVQRQLAQRRLEFDQAQGLMSLALLTDPLEIELCGLLADYPEKMASATEHFKPEILNRYLRDLADELHKYYSARKILVDNAALRCARLCLLLAVKSVLVNGLTLLGVSTPEIV